MLTEKDLKDVIAKVLGEMGNKNSNSSEIVSKVVEEVSSGVEEGELKDN